MTTSTLTIPARSDQVRLARMVAVAAASRAGIEAELLDDVRLAVGEAVAAAVLRSEGATGLTVTIRMVESDSRLSIEVLDQAGADDREDEGFAMAVIQGLVPDVRVESSPEGGRRLVITWPL